MDYSVIPSFLCRIGCKAECCGPVPFLGEEYDRLVEYLAERGEKPREQVGLTCVYVENNRCSVYPVRPLLCRLYGTIPGLRCPNGAGAAQELDALAEAKLMNQYTDLFLDALAGVRVPRERPAVKAGGPAPRVRRR